MNACEPSIGLLLVQVGHAHRKLVASGLDALGVHIGQDHVVHRLAVGEGVSQAELAGTLCVDASTVTKTLGRLERRGLVERRPDPDDARVSRVFLSDAGRALVAPVLDVWRAAEDVLVRNMSEAERLLLARLLRQIASNLASAE